MESISWETGMAMTPEKLKEVLDRWEREANMAMSPDDQKSLLRSFQTRGVNEWSSKICETLDSVARDIIMSCPNNYIRRTCLLRLLESRDLFVATYKYMLEESARYARSDAAIGGIGNPARYGEEPGRNHDSSS